MKPILLLIYAFSYVIPSCAFSSISAKSSVRTDIFLRASNEGVEQEVVDIAIIGAGIGGLCAGAILNTLYNKKVGIYESHYLPGERNVSFRAYHMLKITLYSYHVYAIDCDIKVDVHTPLIGKQKLEMRLSISHLILAPQLSWVAVKNHTIHCNRYYELLELII